MKRTLQFKETESGYVCFENGDNVFEVKKSDLQFDVKAFYEAFYSEDKDYKNIEIENCILNNKEANRVYDCIRNLMSKIKNKLEELPKENIDDFYAERRE